MSPIILFPIFWLLFPAFPVERAEDPTGAGDSFAGGLVGYLAGKDWHDRDRFAEAMAVATAMASLVVEHYGVAGIENESTADVRKPCDSLRDSMRFGPPWGM